MKDNVPHDDPHGVPHEETPEGVIEEAIRKNSHITRAKNAEKADVSVKTIARKLKEMNHIRYDKKLVDTSSRVIKYGITKEGKIPDNQARFSKDFIICLLRTRYLFDKYIVKREYANENSDGEWSLKSLEASRMSK